MIFLLFTLFDILTIFVMVGGHFGVISGVVLFYHSSYLLGKGVWYWRDPFSWIDMSAGVYLILMIFGVSGILTWIYFLYFAYKSSLYFLYA